MRDNERGDNIFLTTNGSSYLNGGNVGIGTTSPASKLDVRGDVYVSNFTKSNYKLHAPILISNTVQNITASYSNYRFVAGAAAASYYFTGCDVGTILYVTNMGGGTGLVSFIQIRMCSNDSNNGLLTLDWGDSAILLLQEIINDVYLWSGWKNTHRW